MKACAINALGAVFTCPNAAGPESQSERDSLEAMAQCGVLLRQKVDVGAFRFGTDTMKITEIVFYNLKCRGNENNRKKEKKRHAHLFVHLSGLDDERGGGGGAREEKNKGEEEDATVQCGSFLSLG